MMLRGILPAIFALHSTGVAVNLSIGAAGRASYSPAGLSAMASRLTVFLVGPHHTLPANTKTLHLHKGKNTEIHFLLWLSKPVWSTRSLNIYLV